MGELHILAQNGNIKGIKNALKNKKAFFSLDDDLGWSPLHYASNRSKAKAVQVMLEAGVSPNIKSKPPKEQKQNDWNLALEENNNKKTTEVYPMDVAEGPNRTKILSHFIKKGASNFLIANRRPERGKKLAEETNGTYIPFEDISIVLPNVDIIVTCTGANFPIITFDQVSNLGELKKQLILMDLSVPRNIQPNIGTIKNISLFTVDELETAISESLISRQQELPKASIIINEVTNEFIKWIKHLSVTPTIADLKHLFEDIQDNELSKIKTKYDNETLDAINVFSKSLLRKILKDPISALKAQASNGHYTPSIVDTLRSIYQLDKPKAVEQD